MFSLFRDNPFYIHARSSVPPPPIFHLWIYYLKVEALSHLSGHFLKQSFLTQFLKKYVCTWSTFKSFLHIYMNTKHGNTIPSLTSSMGFASSKWCTNVWRHCIRKPLFSSVNTYTKSSRFQKSSLWRAFLKRCIFGDQMCLECRQNRRKNLGFQTRHMCGRSLNLLVVVHVEFRCIPACIKSSEFTRKAVMKFLPDWVFLNLM